MNGEPSLRSLVCETRIRFQRTTNVVDQYELRHFFSFSSVKTKVLRLYRGTSILSQLSKHPSTTRPFGLFFHLDGHPFFLMYEGRNLFSSVSEREVTRPLSILIIALETSFAIPEDNCVVFPYDGRHSWIGALLGKKIDERGRRALRNQKVLNWCSCV